MSRLALPAVAVLCVVLLAACAGGAGGARSGSPVVVERSVEELTPKPADARTRAKARTDLAFSYYQEARFALAIDEGRKAVAADPAYAPAYHALGLVYAYIGEMATAQLNFDQAIRLAPKDSEINNSYGWFLCSQGREKEGIEHLMLAARDPLYETPTRPLTNAGLCSIRLKDDKQAEEYFRRAILADGRNTQAMLQLASLQYRASRLDEAKRLVDDVMRRGEPSAEALWLGLRVERKLGNRDAVSNYAGQLRHRFKESSEYQALIQGRYE